MSVRQQVKEKFIKSGVEYKCQICGIFEWLGKKLTLHLDHISGDNSDHRFENLRLLCPNCHSCTATYCGRNNKFGTHKKKVSDEDLLNAMKKAKNPIEALDSVGLVGADNYTRVYRLAKIHNIHHLLEKSLAKKREKNIQLVQLIKKAKIDFSKYGSIQKASNIIGITPQKTRNWLLKNCPELLSQ